MAGLIAAAVGGIVAGSLGGSALQVSGPAAGLTVIVAGLIEQFGWQVTCAITAAAGVIQVLLGAARIGRVALAIAPVVVHAMLAGIGITIVLQQLHVMLGSVSASSAWENITAIPASIFSVDIAAAVLGAVVIVVLVLWKPGASRCRHRGNHPLAALHGGKNHVRRLAPGCAVLPPAAGWELDSCSHRRAHDRTDCKR
jgi:carbonic anhydrase